MSVADQRTADESAPIRTIAPILYAGTSFVSALLLFGVQPMFTKMVLPALGGSPGVWSVAMVFFQSLLLAGYLYAHLSARWLKPAHALALHLLLCLAAFATLPLSVSNAFGAPPEDGQSLWLIAVFAASVGLPFFVLSASAPLLQSWFARTAPAGNPYGLYAASNLGSFAALLGYPLLIEPLLPLKAQAAAWMASFALLAAGLAACGAVALRASQTLDKTSDAATAPAPDWRRKAQWIGLAAVPSGLLVAVTAHLSTDVASAPLLWVVPLALFMLTFVLAFRDRSVLAPGTLDSSLVRLTPFVVLSVVGYALPLAAQLAVHLGFLFLAAMICHGALYRLRPPPARLTEFYLWMSFGGMLSGLFTALLAPLLFSTIVEYRLLVVAALLCAPALRGRASMPRQLLVAGLALALGGALFLAAPEGSRWDHGLPYVVCLLSGTIILSIVIFNSRGPVANAGAAAAAFLALAPIGGAKPEAVARSFFGVNYVRTSADGQLRFLTHGSTYHGYHRMADLEGRPMTGRPLTMAYYHTEGGIALALDAARLSRGSALPDVAVLGLGAGSMACLAQPSETWTFFEIDPEVVKLARRPELFPFLSRCTPDARVVLGDARLKIQAETARYDAIVLDAFSSDAVPAHLLTREAFAIYASRLKPGGVIVAHVSNRYMDLASVAAAAGMAEGMAVLKAHIPVDPSRIKAQMEKAEPTTVVVLAHDAQALSALRSADGWVKPSTEARSALWTDDYANIVGAMWRYWRGSDR
jgi:spermidine synthase